ncbi:MAG: porin [Beijerinckiaceae bacterium]|nr:porin [Beijerinckiaceae bacterium]
MKLVKSLLLGSATAFVAAAGAQAADLPSRKAAPASYVKVCDAYGAGFFYIPGTDTCIKIGGRVRADYSFSAGQDVYSSGSLNGTTGVRTNVLSTSNKAQNLYGWEARGRVDLDARTPTAWGTVQTVLALRLARTTGVLESSGPNLSGNGAGATLEAAYIRFAGFTFGAARDNFSFMPSTFYGAGHWSSFANGAKQLAYTAVLGGGISLTVAVQDASDTTAGGVSAASALFAAPTGVSYSYNNLPQINGRIDLEQGWGSASVMGAVGKAVGVNALATYDTDKTIWAVGAGLKVNLPMLAAGDVLWLNAAYANGMTEYTTNWTSFKSSDTRRNVGGFVINHPSWINTTNAAGGASIETLKSWNLAAVFSHFWTPSIRHSFLGSYGQIDGTTSSKLATYGTTGAFGDAKVWNVGTQLAWLPVRNFEIGVEVLYARVEQDVRRTVTAPGAFAAGATAVTKEKTGNWTGRMRVERTF